MQRKKTAELLKTALNLDADVTEEEGNKLASAIMNSEQARQKEFVLEVATALYNVGQYRITGCGFSPEVSDAIALWIEKYFAEDRVYTDKLISLIYELTSEKSKQLPLRLIEKVNNEGLKASLLDTFCYMGT